VKHSAKLEASVENGSTNSDNIVDRKEVLQWLREDVEWLRKKARNDNPIKNPIRVKLMRASIYGCSVLLQALKDVEIDVLMGEIEKIKDHIGMMEHDASTSKTRNKIH